MAEFNGGGSLTSISVSQVSSDRERIAFPVPSVAETSTVLWGIDSMVVLKEQQMGCQENLGCTCRSVAHWRSRCMFTSSIFCVYKMGNSVYLALLDFLRRSTEKKLISMGVFLLKCKMVSSSYYY